MNLPLIGILYMQNQPRAYRSLLIVASPSQIYTVAITRLSTRRHAIESALECNSPRTLPYLENGRKFKITPIGVPSKTEYYRPILSDIAQLLQRSRTPNPFHIVFWESEILYIRELVALQLKKFIPTLHATGICAQASVMLFLNVCFINHPVLWTLSGSR